MQTSGISSQDQWARFMQLSNIARMRNQGLRMNPTATKRTTAAKRAPAPASAPSGSYPIAGGTRVSRSYAPVQAATPTRIVGGAFDAYA